MRPDVLLCSGLDPSGGAGLVADVRIASELAARPVGVVTAQTVQNTTGAAETYTVDAELVGHQLAYLLSDIEVRAVKIGMIGSPDVARAIADALQLTAAPVVLDPVLKVTRGDARGVGGLAELRAHLTVITPNASELGAFTGCPIRDLGDAEAAGRALAKELGIAVLVKGGHLGGDEAIDLLVHDGDVVQLRAPRVVGGEDVHGTGCALSTALAVYLAHGHELVDACRRAKQFVSVKLADPARPGRGAGAVV